MTLEQAKVLHALVGEARATVDPNSSDELYARQIVGYVQRRAARLSDVVGRRVVPEDLRGLRVSVRVFFGDHQLTLDFSRTKIFRELGGR